ncbi:hypothetical protein VmeM32_00061 [Vibrio phage vB_VmeM-32]|nr:hypothetical protein VmeM32_00061 [Vibrio phage vB_VmeM-32]
MNINKTSPSIRVYIKWIPIYNDNKVVSGYYQALSYDDNILIEGDYERVTEFLEQNDYVPNQLNNLIWEK